jgi:nitrate reductase NapE component
MTHDHDEPMEPGKPPARKPPAGGSPADESPGERRPWLERIGLAAIAFVLFALLSVMAIAAWVGGEWILAAMSASGAILTIGVGLVTLVRG